MANLGLQNNNPGNLRDPNTGQFRVFNTPEEGRQALIQDLQAKQSGQSSFIKPGASIADLANVWAPASDKNVPSNWANNVAKTLGVDTSHPFDQIPVDKLAEGISVAEGTSTMSNANPQNQGTLAQKIKAKYPQYNDIPDNELTQKILQKYPQYQDMVSSKVSNNLSSIPQDQQISQTDQTTKNQSEGFLPSLFRGITAPVVTMLARPVQLGARLLGASNEDINKVSAQVPFYGEGGALNVPETGSDLLKDVGRAGETISLGLPVNTLRGAIGAGALMGAGSGLENNPSVSGVIGGGLSGAALGGVGGTLSKAFEWLPKSLTSTAFKGMNPEEMAQAFANKTIGSKANLLSQSEKSISSLGSQLGAILKNPSYSGKIFNAQDVLSNAAENPQIRQKLLDTGLYFDEIAQKIKSIAPEAAGLVDKFFNEGLSLPDLQRLNSTLGGNVFKRFLDEPTIRAGKDLGSIIYHATSDLIKNTAPETIPIFDELSKEYGIRTALGKMARKSSNSLITWKDLMPFMAGSAFGGPFTGIASALGARVAENPAVQFGAAKTISGLGKVVTPISSRSGLLAPLINR